MSTPILTKTTSAGEAIVRMSPSCVKQLEVVLNGNRLGSGWVQKLQQPQGEITHRVSKLGLTTPEAEIVEAAFQAACAPTLREQRESLVNKLRRVEADQEEAFERGHRSDGSAAHTASQRFTVQLAAAQQAIADFDAAHPEVLDEIRAEKAERGARNAWM